MTRLFLRDVRVHWNLHRKMWSVHRRGRRVRHMRSLTLVRARFKIYERGRQRALEKRVRNVHAFACGDVLGKADSDFVGRMRLTEVSYNPFRRPQSPASFYTKPDGDNVNGALMLMFLSDGRVFACEPEHS